MKNEESRFAQNEEFLAGSGTVPQFFIKARLRTLKFPFISASSRTPV